ncbi:MAG: EAL domain-containing protein [Helicobacteraceae bacterium]|jgi:diguanylate cyclase (GGDEF)-like protein/PAS domain S-box-containing protein|nr:EAL domain-containing protein [Helicobacteraceae bacterium]
MKLRLTLRFLFPWILMGALGAILLALYLFSESIDGADRNRAELDVRKAIALDTEIDLDMLRLRYRQLFNYDSLTRASLNIEETLDRLEEEFDRLGVKESLEPAREKWTIKERLLDDFKRQNSVLGNSVYHFINVSNRLQATNHNRAYERRSIFISAVQSVLIYISDQQNARRDIALRAIERLEEAGKKWRGEDGTLAQLLAVHGRLILANHTPVRQTMRDMTLNGFVDDLSEAYAVYLAARSEALERADGYRKLMTIFSLIMIMSVIAIILRLQQTAEELAQSNRLLHNINEHLSEGILSFDDKSELTFINGKAETLIGKEARELLGKTKTEALNLVDNTQNAAFDEAFEKRQPFMGEAWLKKIGGDRYPAFFLGGPLPMIDGGVGYVASFRDVTTQYEAEARLRLAAKVFDNLAEAMTVTDARGRIRSVNAAFTAITGYSEEEAIGFTPGRILGSGQHSKEFYRAMWAALKNDGKWFGEIINRRKNGELFPEWLSITAVKNKAGVAEQYIALFNDISERKQAEEYIHRLAYYDPLTGLANRALFNDRLENAIRQAHRADKMLAVMYLDLDRFKSVNDSLGHVAGDTLLKKVGALLKKLVREGDTLSRFGGDEFAVLLPEIDDTTYIESVARNILEAFEKSFELNSREVFCSTSMGIAIYPSDSNNAADLLKNADVALYNAKNAGRANFQYFQNSANEDFLARFELETALRHAVERNELVLYYQPQVDSQSGRIYGVEALARWRHPTMGLLQPDRFIPIAEHIGYIDAIGVWCLQTACEQLVKWQKDGVAISRVAVNVSPRQLKSPKFVENAINIIKATKIDPKCLELELTESSMTDNSEKTIEIFSKLRKKGIRIAIDDFGTGYSSFSYLARYPVDVLKVDKSFVQDIGEKNDASAVVRSIALLAHSLSMEIVAEGVETHIQRDYLTRLKCELLQGYLYSPPVPAEDIPDLTRSIA